MNTQNLISIILLAGAMIYGNANFAQDTEPSTPNPANPENPYPRNPNPNPDRPNPNPNNPGGGGSTKVPGERK